jgi:hypothetical protein
MGKWKKADGEATFMTSFVGEVVTTYDRLVEVFGEPHYVGSSDEKVTAEWAISFNGDVATIYDWKMGRTPLEEYAWHIGGHKASVVNKIKALVA